MLSLESLLRLKTLVVIMIELSEPTDDVPRALLRDD